MIRFACLLALVVFLEDVGADRSWNGNWNGNGRRYWRKPSKPKCEPVKCDEGCVEEIDPNGCKKCICAPVCPKLECPFECSLEKLSPDSPCPACICDKKEEEDDEYDDEKSVDIRSHEVPACSPPKCRPGCQIETVFEGPCPGCKCSWDQPSGPAGGRNRRRKQSCDLVKCDDPDCDIVKKDDGCEICECKPKKPIIKCDPPKCGHGCKIEDDPKGPCPVCVCKEEEKEIDVILDVKKIDDDLKKGCPALIDECKKPGCSIVIDEFGCDICKCVPSCVPPKCPRRCKIEAEKDDECPKCVCPKWFGRG